MAQQPFVFVNATITNDATAVSVLSLLGITPTGACVSLNVTCNTDTYWGRASTVTNTTGGLVQANNPVADSATGVAGNTIPIESMFIYNHSGGDSTAVVYARFIP